MRALLSPPRLALLLGVVAGIVWFLWEAHNLGQSCGYRSGHGLPSFPVKTAFVLLVAAPTILTALRTIRERRPTRIIVSFTALAAVLAGVMIGIAELIFVASRHCFA